MNQLRTRTGPGRLAEGGSHDGWTSTKTSLSRHMPDAGGTSSIGGTRRSVPALRDHGDPVGQAQADHLQLRARRHEHRRRPQQSSADAQRALRDRGLEGAVRQGGDGLAEGGQRQLHARLRQRLRPGSLRQPAERQPVRRHPDRRLRHVGQHPGVRLPRSPGQRRDQRRRHVLQHHAVVADQRHDVRPDDGGHPRVRPRDRHGSQHATARRPCTRPTTPPSRR